LRRDGSFASCRGGAGHELEIDDAKIRHSVRKGIAGVARFSHPGLEQNVNPGIGGSGRWRRLTESATGQNQHQEKRCVDSA
jgi:hypothetical protein